MSQTVTEELIDDDSLAVDVTMTSFQQQQQQQQHLAVNVDSRNNVDEAMTGMSNDDELNDIHGTCMLLCVPAVPNVNSFKR